MNIAILAVRDTGGTAYTLAHAINNICPEHHAISIRGVPNFINYPTFVETTDHNRATLRDMTYKADVVVFLGAMAPLFDFLHLQKTKLKDKKKILLCMGSEWRYGRNELIKQADDLLKDYKIVLGGADMFLPLTIEHPETHVVTDFPETDDKEVGYLPVVRSMDEIERTYSLCNQDKDALKAFMVPHEKVMFTHAPTSEVSKGSTTFYRVATRAQQAVRNMIFKTVKMQTWATTLSILSQTDVLYDQAPPFPTAYGALSVEAGIFKVPSFSRIAPEAQAWIKRKTGLDTPYITFGDENDLFQKTVRLATDEKLRRTFGKMNYNYCKALHDEAPVVNRFLKIVEAM
jgi:hypothetical protein